MTLVDLMWLNFESPNGFPQANSLSTFDCSIIFLACAVTQQSNAPQRLITRSFSKTLEQFGLMPKLDFARFCCPWLDFRKFSTQMSLEKMFPTKYSLSNNAPDRSVWNASSMAALQVNNFYCFSEYFWGTLSELQMNFPHDRTPVATFWCDKVTQKKQNRRQSTITLHQTFSLSPTVQQAELLLSAKLPCAMNFSSSSLCLHWTWTKKRERYLSQFGLVRTHRKSKNPKRFRR